MIDSDMADEIREFVNAKEWDLGEFELAEGVWLHIDWSLENHRDRPVVFVDVGDNGLNGYESPESAAFLHEVCDEAEDLSMELEEIFRDTWYNTRVFRFESDGHTSQGTDMFHL